MDRGIIISALKRVISADKALISTDEINQLKKKMESLPSKFEGVIEADELSTHTEGEDIVLELGIRSSGYHRKGTNYYEQDQNSFDEYAVEQIAADHLKKFKNKIELSSYYNDKGWFAVRVTTTPEES